MAIPPISDTVHEPDMSRPRELQSEEFDKERSHNGGLQDREVIYKTFKRRTKRWLPPNKPQTNLSSYFPEQV